MSGLLRTLYSALTMSVNVVAVALSCDPALTRLFTPLHPVLGRFEVCTTERPFAEVARADWTVEELEPLDAFGGAGPYDRAAVARLYGGQRVKVARGWTQDNGRFESVTILSPYPDASLTRLQGGTLVIRWVLTDGH
jgi:hypothetical protein